MADSINLDIGYFDHIKTVRLASMLGRGAEMLPIRLWCYCGIHPKDNGTLTDFSADDVEAVILKWWGKRGQAVEALVKVGFLDFDGTTYRAHGFNEKNGHIIAFHERAVKAAGARWGKLRGEECLSIATSNATSISKQCPTDRPTDRPTEQPKKEKIVEIPQDLLSIEKEIREFLSHRKSIGKAVKPDGAGKLWGMIRGIAEKDRVKAIENSMACGYQGIFQPKGGSNGHSRIAGEANYIPGKYAHLSH